jgi:hypothetical protein
VLPLAPSSEPTIVRRVFAQAWSIEIPASFAETFVHEDGYWHAYHSRRSVSMTSFAVSDERGPANAEALAQQIPWDDGEPVPELPDGLPGKAMIANAPRGARASRILSGVLAVDGRLLIVTITADDLAWARATWLSIRCHRTGAGAHGH